MTTTNKTYTIVSEKELDDCAFEFELESSADTLQKKYEKNLQELTARAEIQGFRRGKAPATLIEREYGAMNILQDAATELAQDIATLLIGEKKLNIVDRPTLTLTQLAPKNPLKFKIRVEVMPEMTLSDYKKIAGKKNAKRAKTPEVTDKELQEAIERVRKLAAKHAGDEKKLPELTDEFVKSIGGFETVGSFTERLKKDLAADKERAERERHRLEIAEEVIKSIPNNLPESLITYELERMEASFKGDLERVGLTIDDFLKKSNKTIDALKKEWRPDALKRVKMEIMIAKISDAEKLVPDTQTVEHEAKHLMEHYKDADPNNVKSYVVRMLTNQLVFNFLESIGSSVPEAKTPTEEKH